MSAPGKVKRTRRSNPDLRPTCLAIAMTMCDLATAGRVTATNAGIATAAGVKIYGTQSGHVSRALRVMRRAGLIHMAYAPLQNARTITILDEDLVGAVRALLD